MTAAEITEMYERVKRPSLDWSLTEAIRFHSQACGLVAYVLNIHPDRVAEAVKSRQRETFGESRHPS